MRFSSTLLAAVTVSAALFQTSLVAQTARGGTADSVLLRMERAIRADNLKDLQSLTAIAKPDLADRLKTTPLHYAALFGSPESMGILLGWGADPNAVDSQGGTPLLYAAYNGEKTHLLVDHGAAAKIANHNGITPLMVAASTRGNSATVQLLLAHDADPLAVNLRGQNALFPAFSFGDEGTVRALIDAGIPPGHKDKSESNVLVAFGGVSANDGRVQLVLSKPLDLNASNNFAGKVKNGPIELIHLTPLLLSAPYSRPETVTRLLSAGAHINDTDIRKMSALTLAVASDFANPQNVKALIDAGADVNQLDRNGESILDWALKFRQPQILSLLHAAGARSGTTQQQPVRPASTSPVDPRTALARAQNLLATSGQGFFREGGGCVGCHHQPMAGRAYAAARAVGASADDRLRKLVLDGVIAIRPLSVSLLPTLLNNGGDVDSVLAPLLALADLGEPPSIDTDLMVHYVAARQLPSGAWYGGDIARPPIEDSNISRTAFAIRALTAYPWPARQTEFFHRVSLARAWLLNAVPQTNYERADRLMGLFYAHAPADALKGAAKDLQHRQARDGGWSQTAYLDSDAYATGLALHALRITGYLQPDSHPYRRGVQYLLNTQFPDGSWYVRSRAPKFQPYFQSGFPFDHDQWISAYATGWAAMALAPAAASTHTTVAHAVHSSELRAAVQR